MNVFKRLYAWYYRKWVDDDHPEQIKVNKLKWLPQKLVPKHAKSFGYLDTIEFAIDKIPQEKETIIDIYEVENNEITIPQTTD